MSRPKRKLGTPEFVSDYDKIWSVLDTFRKRCEDEALDPLAAYLGLMSMAELFHIKTHRVGYEEAVAARAQKVMRDRLDQAWMDALKEINEFESALKKQDQV
jgi:hypothetical protein